MKCIHFIFKNVMFLIQSSYTPPFFVQEVKACVLIITQTRWAGNQDFRFPDTGEGSYLKNWSNVISALPLSELCILVIIFYYHSVKIIFVATQS